MRLLLCFSTFALLAGGEDAQKIVRRSVRTDDANWERARNYTFLERREERSLDRDGRVKSRDIETWDVTLLEGTPFTRLVERDDKPLSAKEERKEEERVRKSIEERRQETPDQRARRLAKWEEERRKQRELLREVPEAFDFELAGEETIDSHEAWVLQATPRAGYRPSRREAKIFPKLRGRLWVGKQDYQWLKAEAEVIGTISFGLMLARVQKGTWLRFELTRVNDEVWLPRRVDASGAARLALLVKLRRELEITYRNYRKFQSDSRVVSVGDGPER